MDAKLLKIVRSGKVDALKDIDDTALTRTTPKNNTVLHIASKLGRKNFADQISNRCPKLLLVQNSRGDTAIHITARAQNPGLVSLLITCAKQEGFLKDMLRKLNSEHNTALHEAARNRNHKVVELLTEEDPMLGFIANKTGASPLYLAAEGGCLESVHRILSILKESPHQRPAFGGPHQRTPLHASVIRENLEITKMLIGARPDLISQKDKYENSPLHYAAAVGNLEIVRELLQSNTSIAYDEDNHKRSPLHVAASNGHVKVIKEILKFIPDPGEVVDGKGWNALHVAVERENLDVVRYILNSNDLGELINQPNSEGNTPLHLAIINRQLSVSSLLIRDKRVDVNAMNCKGDTALDIAESDKNLRKKLQKILVTIALIQVGGRRGLHRRDKAYRKPRTDSYKGMSTVISTVAALIITASFSAASTLPGGYNNNSDGPDKGKAILIKKSLLWLFVITDATALFSSISIVLLLLCAGIGDDDLLVAAISVAMRLMLIAIGSLSLAFLFGLWSVLSKGLAVVVPLIFVGVLFLGVHCSWSQFPLLDLYFKLHFPYNLTSIFGVCSSKRSAVQCSCKNRSTNQSCNSEKMISRPLYQPSNSTKMGNWRTRLSFGNLLQKTVISRW